MLGGYSEGARPTCCSPRLGRSVFTRSCGPSQHRAPRGRPTTHGEPTGSTWKRSPKVTAELWGSEGYGAAFAKVEAAAGNVFPPELVAMMGRLSRHTATPDVAVTIDRIWNETDVRPILPSVSAPTLLLASWKDEADYVASLMPRAEVRILPASRAEHDAASIGYIREWLGVAPPAPNLDRVLAAVLFTDIVGSTERLVELGDAGWRSLLARHMSVRGHRDRTPQGPLRRLRGRRHLRDLRWPSTGGAVRAGNHEFDPQLGHPDPSRRAYGRGGARRRCGSRHRGTRRGEGRIARRPGQVLATSTVKDLWLAPGSSSRIAASTS